MPERDPPVREHADGSRKTRPFDILVVDDSYPLARALSYALTRAGYTCRIARDGVEALERMDEQPPDLVVLDLRMPRMDGLETCRRIRENEAWRDAYIIVLSGIAHEGDAARAIEAGADECLSKPFEPPKILERVRAVLSPVES